MKKSSLSIQNPSLLLENPSSPPPLTALLSADTAAEEHRQRLGGASNDIGSVGGVGSRGDRLIATRVVSELGGMCSRNGQTGVDWMAEIWW